MMKRWSILSLATQAAAFPAVLEHLGQWQQVPRDGSQETNCGPTPCTFFDAKEQYVDVTEGSGNEFVAPTAQDQRGPCPGLK